MEDISQLPQPLADPFDETPKEKKTRRRGNKIEVDGEIQELLELNNEEVTQWFRERQSIYNDIIHGMVTDKETPKPVRVKLLELITKITGQVTEKHEIVLLNAEDIAQRGIQAAKELREFEIKLLEVKNE